MLTLHTQSRVPNGLQCGVHSSNSCQFCLASKSITSFPFFQRSHFASVVVQASLDVFHVHVWGLGAWSNELHVVGCSGWAMGLLAQGSKHWLKVAYHCMVPHVNPHLVVQEGDECLDGAASQMKFVDANNLARCPGNGNMREPCPSSWPVEVLRKTVLKALFE